MARKGWENLNPKYRNRLERTGITRKAYERGASIVKGRGHAKTPEKPHLVKPHHVEYSQRREALYQQIDLVKQQLWSTYPKWNPIQAEANTRSKTTTWTIADLQKEAKLTPEEMLHAIRTNPKKYAAAFGYK